MRNPGASLPPPPHDLIVSRMECHPFIAPDMSVKVPKTPNNAHYHLHMECLTAVDLGSNQASVPVSFLRGREPGNVRGKSRRLPVPESGGTNKTAE